MQSNRVLTRKVLNTYLPVEARCGNLHIKVKDKEALHKILACISTDGNYKNFKSMSTWKTIAGFGGVAQEIFVKKIIFHKTKDKLRESLILPQKRYGYRSAVGECFNLITAEKRKLNTPRVLALIKKKRYFIDYEHHLIIESIPTSISLNTAISKNIISIDIAFDVISTAINELYNAKAIHLDFHLENIIINPKNP
jgi:hypothetical protein